MDEGTDYEKDNDVAEHSHERSNEKEVHDTVEEPMQIPGMTWTQRPIVRVLAGLEHNGK